ncbi:MAG: hypothetical protein IPJ76_17950 [Flavobacteriales bacterium]|nr:MAG: hypothetical protein IPJ76_17950 [Flavobacteriales bacterium]
MIETERITIRAYRAVDEPSTCREFLRGHAKVLEDFGIQNVTTNNPLWCSDPDTYVLVAITKEHGMIGGIRLEVSKPGRILPMQDALKKFEPGIAMRMAGMGKYGMAEVCGLWVANQMVGKGLPGLLALSAVSMANQIGMSSLVCLVAHYTLRQAVRSGFTPISDIGDQGKFSYPIPSITAYAMAVPDAISLETTPTAQREALMSLRLRPVQERSEQLAGKNVQVRYLLQLTETAVNMTLYGRILVDRLARSA